MSDNTSWLLLLGFSYLCANALVLIGVNHISEILLIEASVSAATLCHFLSGQGGESVYARREAPE